MHKALDVILRRTRIEPDVPVCPQHKIEMRLRGKIGRPTRFSSQTEGEYTAIYFCPAIACNHTVERNRVRTQIPVPGEQPDRPSFGRDPEQSTL